MAQNLGLQGLDMNLAMQESDNLNEGNTDGSGTGAETGWWAGLSKGAKIGIGVGGAVVLGGIVFAIVKMSKKP
jgi:hypothetical protein